MTNVELRLQPTADGKWYGCIWLAPTRPFLCYTNDSREKLLFRLLTLMDETINQEVGV